MTAARLLPALLRLDAAFNAALGIAVLAWLAPLTGAAGLPATWPAALFAVACLDNAAVCWWAARPGAAAARTRLTAVIDLALAVTVFVWLAISPGMAAWLTAALVALGTAAVAVGVVKLLLAARTARLVTAGGAVADLSPAAPAPAPGGGR